MRYRFSAEYPSAVTARLSGDGKAKLTRWADESTGEDGGTLWLTDLADCRVSLRLTPAAIDDAANWNGETFDAPSSLLDIEVDADDPAGCYAVLAKRLFRFGGEAASFPVHATPHVEGGARQVGKQIDARRSLSSRRGGKAKSGDAVDLEYITVSVPASVGNTADNWQPVSEGEAKAQGEGEVAAESQRQAVKGVRRGGNAQPGQPAETARIRRGPPGVESGGESKGGGEAVRRRGGRGLPGVESGGEGEPTPPRHHIISPPEVRGASSGGGEQAAAADGGEAGLGLLERRLAAKANAGGGVGFDPILIIAIIAAIIPLIQNCFFNATPRTLRKRLLNRARVAAAIRRETQLPWGDCRQRAEQLFDLADEATDEELRGLIDDCCR